MAECSDIKTYDNQNVTLALATSNSILRIAELLKAQQTNRELKNFYLHLPIYCLLVSHHIKRIRSDLGGHYKLVVRILTLFESLISPCVIESKHGKVASTYPRQRALNQHWNNLKSSSENTKLEIFSRYLVVGESNEPQCLQKFDETFYTWVEEIMSKYPEDDELWSADECPPPKNRDEPSYAVWNAAQSLFNALSRCTKCECHPNELGARLCLSTYRNLDLGDGNDFDMFLYLQHISQEVHVHTVKDTVVRFDMTPKPGFVAKKLDYKPMLIQRLCEVIQKMQEKPSWRLELKVEKDKLLKLRSEMSTFQIDREKPPVTLQNLITKDSQHLTVKIKRILAVLLSYAVLHLHGTAWLQSTWDSSKILFFRTTSSKIPLRPYIQTELGNTEQWGEESQPHISNVGIVTRDDIGPDELDMDDLDPDDLDPDDFEHPFPSLVTLAVILMELYLVAPFKELAKNRSLEVLGGSRTRSLDVTLVFKEYKNEIPQNSKFYYAIDKCLDPRTWEDDNGQKLDNEVLRATIYKEVIRPLEDELCDGFSSITIEKLDEIAETLDVTNWGQVIHDCHLEVQSQKPCSIHAIDENLIRQYRNFEGSSSFSQNQSLISTTIPPVTPSHIPGLGTPIEPESQYEAPKFWDDEEIPESISQLQFNRYKKWRERYKAVYQAFIEPYSECSPKSPVKIAILDTGVDETHHLLNTELIKFKRNWVNKESENNVSDYVGHGTFTASLVAEYSPDAELYIAKIADIEPSPPKTIAKAIRFAVDDWGVDIISMSFGYPSKQIQNYNELENAILHAHSKSVLMFAAASNNGANLDRAHPARDPHVICVHSTDANGGRSSFSPTAIEHDLNIATVGESVQSAWTIHLCNAKLTQDYSKYKSGTSYATPILVGIAAFLLQYVRIHLKDEEACMLKRQYKMKEVLLKISEKTQKSSTRDGYNYVSLSLFDDILFGRRKESIDATLRELLVC